MPLTLTLGLETLKQKPEEPWGTKPELSCFSRSLVLPCQCNRLDPNTAPELDTQCWCVPWIEELQWFAGSVLCPVLLQRLSRTAENLDETFRWFFPLVLSSIFAVVSLWKLLTCGLLNILNPKPSEAVEALSLTLIDTNSASPRKAEFLCRAVHLSGISRSLTLMSSSSFCDTSRFLVASFGNWSCWCF